MSQPEASASVESFVTDKGKACANPNADHALVERVQAGHIEAFDILVKKYRERLYSVIYNLTSNREDAADLTQEAFIKAFSSIHKFRKKSNFFTWIYRIAVNTTLTHLKKHRYRHFLSFEKLNDEAGHANFIETIASNSKTDKSALIKELQEKLNEALQKLSFKHRTVVVLHEIEGLSHQEIAQVTGSSVGTVRSRLHYAKQQLQSQLQDYLK